MRRIDFHVNLLPDFARVNVNAQAIPDESPHLRHCFDLPVTAGLNRRCEPSSIIAAMDRGGVEKCVAFSYQWQSAERCRIANDAVTKAVSAHRERFYGLAVVQPRDQQSIADLDRLLDQPGMIGVKMKPRWGGFALSEIDVIGPVCEMLIARNGILLTHVSQGFHRSTGDQLSDLFVLLDNFPKLKVVAAHLGGFAGVYECYAPAQRRLENLWVDISLPSNLKWLPHLMRLGNPHRYVYATDWPYVDYDRFDAMLDATELSAVEREQLSVSNPRALLQAIGEAA